MWSFIVLVAFSFFPECVGKQYNLIKTIYILSIFITFNLESIINVA